MQGSPRSLDQRRNSERKLTQHLTQTPSCEALKRGGVQVPIVGSQSLGREIFQSLFADLPEEKRSPGHFAEGVYATSPVILDAANKDTLDFAEGYSDRFGREPGWTAVKYYEAAQ